MSERLEWAHASSGAELLFPGEDIDGAVVEPGEIAVAVWTGSNGIALHGPREAVRDRLLQLALAVHEAPPVPFADACIPERTDPRRWRPAPLPRPLAPNPAGPALCGGADRPAAADPRLATCPDCIERWNNDAPLTRLSLTHAVPAPS
ncbi:MULTISPECIES: hypothetical protein [unclassified Streptomyces]|uniref:Uncharacterized protein n=1 Tax=Streptomyces sp. F2 TaxID=317660 RepID=V9Z863_9ACTN|nr:MULTISPECIES: hypothetical protein [unclassified Streptomyces]AHE39591.1 Hypothetical protein pFRL4_358c [Streptomyces sp. F2]